MKVFIIHGWTYTLDAWKKLETELNKRHIEPVMLHVPGLTSPSDQVWDINQYVAWLDKELSDEERPVIIGHSNGGRIALHYVQRYPNKLDRLILIGSAGMPHENPKTIGKLKVLRLVAKAGKPLKALPFIGKVFYKLIGAKDYHNAPPNMKRTMQNMLDTDKDINLSKIGIPVTLIWGREDRITPLEDGQKMAEAINNAKLHILDDARHSPYATQPEKVADIIERAAGQK